MAPSPVDKRLASSQEGSTEDSIDLDSNNGKSDSNKSHDDCDYNGPAAKKSSPSIKKEIILSKGSESSEELPRTHIIFDVWKHNCYEEFERMRHVAKTYTHVALDTEFPGVVGKLT